MAWGLEDLWSDDESDVSGGLQQAPDTRAEPVIDLTGDAEGSTAEQQSNHGQQQQPQQAAPTAAAAAAAATPNTANQQLERRMQQALLKADHYNVGPNLQEIRHEQTQTGVREYYGLEHLQRLLRFEASQPYRGSSKVYCKNVHGAGCTQCKTCHFCRQKTIDVKTFCSRCANSRKRPIGGPGRGYWCGACLQSRMGENIEEVVSMKDWACPACRDICNCSAPRCQRSCRGLKATDQLVHEAHGLGYKSVAHYLILTHLDASGHVAPMPRIDPAAHQQQQRAQAAAAATVSIPQVLAVPGSGASAAALQADGSRRRRTAKHNTRLMLEACELEFAPPAGDIGCLGGTFSDAAAGISNSILDDSHTAEDDMFDDFEALSHRGSLLGLGPGNDPESVAQAPTGAAAAGSMSEGNGPRTSTGSDRGASVGSGGSGALMPGRGILGQQPVLGIFEGLGVLGIDSFGTATIGNLGTSTGGRQRAQAGAAIEGTAPVGNAAAMGRNAVLAAAAVGGYGTGTAINNKLLQLPTLMATARSVDRPVGQSGLALNSMRLQQQQHPGAAEQQLDSLYQQQQQEASRGAQSEPPAQSAAVDARQQQRLQQLQVLDSGFGPSDLPRGDAPGYSEPATGSVIGGNSSRRPGHIKAPASSLFTEQHSKQSKQPEGIGWLSASVAGFGTASLVGRQQAAGGQQRHSMGQGMAISSRAGATAAATTATADGDDWFASMAADGAAAEPASKRMLMMEPHWEARTEGSDQPHHQQQPQQQPCMQPNQQQQQQPPHHSQQQQQQHSANVAGAAAAAAASWADDDDIYTHDSTELFPDELAEQLRSLEHLERMCLQTPGKLPQAGCSGPAKQMCTNVLDQAFYLNNDWDEPVVVNHFAGASKGSLTKLRSATNILISLSKLLPLDMVSFDIIRRLRGLDPFLDFKASDPQARCMVLNTAISILVVLCQRGSADAALQATAAHLASNALSGAAAARQAVTNAAKVAIDAIAAAQRGMLELCELLLEIVGWLQEEYDCLMQWTHTPQDLLGPITVGPIKWHSAHAVGLTAQPVSAAPSLNAAHNAWQLEQQCQQQQEDMREERKFHLGALAKADSHMLVTIMGHVAQKAQHLPRRVAIALLEGPHLGSLLSLQMPCSAKARTTFLSALTNLITQAAPDLRQDRRWLVQDPEQLLQLLQQQQQQAGLQQQYRPGLTPQLIGQEQVDLLHLVLESQMPAAQRLEQVQHVEQCVRQHALPHIEQLVATENTPREGWVKETYQPKPEAQQQQHQQHQQQPWFTGHQQFAKVYNGLSVQHQEKLRQHCIQIGHQKVAALAAVYALQLQAGMVSWQAMEKQLVAPASSLNQFGEFYHSFSLRQLVLGTAAEMVQRVPSLLQWQDQQQQQYMGSRVTNTGPGRPRLSDTPAAGISAAASASGPCHVPADWMLRLWLRSAFDIPGKCPRNATYRAKLVLANNPATAQLFSSCSSISQQQFIGDIPGNMRAQVLCGIGRALLGDAGSEGSAGHLGLRDMLSGLPQVLRARQAELESQSKPQNVLGWQRSCMPGLMMLVDLIANTVVRSSSPAACQQQQWQRPPCGKTPKGATSTAAAAVLHDLWEILKQLLSLASSWLKAGIVAVCKYGTGSSSRSGGIAVGTSSGSGPSGSGAADFTEVLQLMEWSALAELKKYLGLLVCLAGQGCLLDGVSAAAWPPDTSNTSITLQQLWANRNHRPQQQQHHPAWQQQHKQGSVAPPSLPCLSELVTVLVQVPSAGDELQPQEQLLMQHVAQTFAVCGGIYASAQSTHAAEGPAAMSGYSSPGLLHLLLGTHVRLVLETASDRATLTAHSRAVNALHLVKALFKQPGMLEGYGQQVLLAGLARPLLKLLTEGSCQAAQYQAYQLLQQLLCSQAGQQLLPPGVNAVATGPGPSSVSFGSGVLRTMSALPKTQLQHMILQLLKASVQSTLNIAGNAVGATAIATAEAKVQQHIQQLQQLPQPALSQYGHAAEPAALNESIACQVGQLGLSEANHPSQPWLPFKDADASALNNSLFCITGPPAEMSADLNAWQAALSSLALGATNSRPRGACKSAVAATGNKGICTAAEAVGPAGGVLKGAERPADYKWRLAKAALAFCTQLAGNSSVVQQQVRHIVPGLYHLMVAGDRLAVPLVKPYKELLQQMPQQLQVDWRLPDFCAMPPPAIMAQRQQQVRQAAGPANSAAGIAPGNKQKRHQPLQQQNLQRQGEQTPQLQQQQQHRQRPGPACSSQACNAAPAARDGKRGLGETGQAADVPGSKRYKVQVPADSEVASELGGRAASCDVIMATQATTVGQPLSQAAAPAVMQATPSTSLKRRLAIADTAAAPAPAAVKSGQQNGEQEECSSSLSTGRGSAEHAQPGCEEAPTQQQQRHHHSDCHQQQSASQLTQDQQRTYMGIGKVTWCGLMQSQQGQVYRLTLQLPNGGLMRITLTDGLARRACTLEAANLLCHGELVAVLALKLADRKGHFVASKTTRLLVHPQPPDQEGSQATEQQVGSAAGSGGVTTWRADISSDKDSVCSNGSTSQRYLRECQAKPNYWAKLMLQYQQQLEQCEKLRHQQSQLHSQQVVQQPTSQQPVQAAMQQDNRQEQQQQPPAQQQQPPERPQPLKPPDGALAQLKTAHCTPDGAERAVLAEVRQLDNTSQGVARGSACEGVAGPAVSGIQDSQATIKYMTLPSQ